MYLMALKPQPLSCRSALPSILPQQSWSMLTYAYTSQLLSLTSSSLTIWSELKLQELVAEFALVADVVPNIKV